MFNHDRLKNLAQLKTKYSMKNLITVILIGLLFNSCKVSKEELNNKTTSKTETLSVINEEYELDKPALNINGVLILFGGYGEPAAGIKNEFEIQELAQENKVSVLYMNYNRNLWMEETEKDSLAQKIQEIFKENELPKNNVYIGGLSSGGNVSMLISSYFASNKQYNLTPKGVFIVDAPIDLSELYKSAKVNVENDFSENIVAESNWILTNFEAKFGNPQDDISAYEEYSVATLSTDNIQNIEALKNTEIRFYTEPDTTWWKENSMAEYETLNAFHIKRLSKMLQDKGFNKLEYIETSGKGYRANGERNPHSWSIVDPKGLITWMLKD